jgi:hypothetical protein
MEERQSGFSNKNMPRIFQTGLSPHQKNYAPLRDARIRSLRGHLLGQCLFFQYQFFAFN